MQAEKQILVLEDASLQLIPRKFHREKSAQLVFSRFGIRPEHQLLDDNFHHEIIQKIDGGSREKVGRPDVVHLALLDATSTPLFQRGLVEVVIHTISNRTIILKPNVRIPRTFPRFCGVFSRLLSDDPIPNPMFETKSDQDFSMLADSFGTTKGSRVILLSSLGIRKNLREFIEESDQPGGQTIWVVGGFARGHFSEGVRAEADEIISISEMHLPAHVVTARLCYDLEEQIVKQNY